MRALGAVFRKEVRENLRERRTVIAALVFGPLFVPLLFATMLATMMQRSAAEAELRTLPLAIAHPERAPRLIEYLHEYGVEPRVVDYDDAAARAAVHERREPMVLMVPEEYASQLARAAPAPLLLYADSSQGNDARDVARIKSILAQYSLTVARLRLIARGLDPLVLSVVAVQDVDVATPASRSVLALGALSYLILITMLMGGLYLAIDATAGERERGSLEPLLTVPVPREQLIYGKILAAAAFMLLSLTLTVAALAVVLRFVGLERYGMSVNFGPLAALAVIAVCVPLVPLGAALMTIVAAFTRSYREAQTYVGLMLLVPTLPLVFAGAAGLRPTALLMAVPSLSQHFLIMSLLREERLPAAYLAISVGVTLTLGLVLCVGAGRLYRREALLG
jgi:sodium transport system permease protein